jgi:hypothetical protein
MIAWLPTMKSKLQQGLHPFPVLRLLLPGALRLLPPGVLRLLLPGVFILLSACSGSNPEKKYRIGFAQ